MKKKRSENTTENSLFETKRFSDSVTIDSPKNYLQRFSTDLKTIEKIISFALENGGDYCDLFFQQTISNDFLLEEEKVCKAYSSNECGVGVRVLHGEQCGYCYSEDLSLKSILQAAKTAALIAQSRKKIKTLPINLPKNQHFFLLQNELNAVPVEKKITLLKELNTILHKKDRHVFKTSISFNDETSWVLIANSHGTIAYDYRPLSELSATLVMEIDGKKESNRHSLSWRGEFSIFTKQRMENFVETLIKRTSVLFSARQPSGGEMPLVLAPGSSGILLHEAIGHGLEADFNRKKISIFADKIGKRVASPEVTIVDHGSLTALRGSYSCDDEGTPSAKTILVEKGILVGFLQDYLNSRLLKMPLTGNGRRESFRRPPVPRMSNTYMTEGSFAPEEILRSVKYGIYAETFTNGQVQIGAGDFTFYVKNGFLIENGHLTAPIKDVNIIGNGPEVLKRIEMVGNDLQISQGTWTCGKDGQDVPVSQGLPTTKIAAITVGGAG